MIPRTHLRAALACAYAIALLGTVMLGLLLPLPDQARELDLVLHTGSYHFDRAQRFEEFNPGAGLRLSDAHGPQGGYWQAGAYRNSVGRTTVYAVRGVNLLRVATASGAVTASAFAGAGTGYAVRVAERRVFFKTPAPPCLDPKGCPPWPDSSDLVRVYEPTSRITPLAGAALSWDTGAMGLHLVLTPTFRTGGQTRNYGAAALLVSFPIGR